jgi:hypothetical protein
LLQLLGALSQLPVLGLHDVVVVWVRAVGELVFAVSDPQPAGQARRGDPEATGDLLPRLLTQAGNRDHVATELDRVWSRHAADPSIEDLVLAGKESTKPWADPPEL